MPDTYLCGWVYKSGVWMAGQGNAAPVIIKRKKVIQGGGHHGGAWKVAYADFVTAMMAFFMLMWLLNATTDKQRKGLADYFDPSIPIARVSGGGDGAFGGDSTFSEQALTQSGTGAAPGDSGTEKESEDAAAEKAALEEVEQTLLARNGESMTMENLLRHVVTRVTDEGLVIELFDLPDLPLFDAETSEPTAQMRQLSVILSEVLAISTNEIAVNGHVKSFPIMRIDSPVWPVSSARAMVVRDLLAETGLEEARIQRVTGYADRVPVTSDPMAIRNNRIEVVLLRRNR